MAYLRSFNDRFIVNTKELNWFSVYGNNSGDISMQIVKSIFSRRKAKFEADSRCIYIRWNEFRTTIEEFYSTKVCRGA